MGTFTENKVNYQLCNVVYQWVKQRMHRAEHLPDLIHLTFYLLLLIRIYWDHSFMLGRWLSNNCNRRSKIKMEIYQRLMEMHFSMGRALGWVAITWAITFRQPAKVICPRTRTSIRVFIARDRHRMRRTIHRMEGSLTLAWLMRVWSMRPNRAWWIACYNPLLETSLLRSWMCPHHLKILPLKGLLRWRLH